MANRGQPEDKDQLLIQTPYGKGLVVRTRKDGVREVQLLEWEKTVRSSRLATKQYGYGNKASLKLYSTSDWKSVEPQRGDDVLTPYGRGRITNVISVVIKKKKTTGDSNTAQTSEKGEPKPPDGNNVESRKLIKYQVELSAWRLAGRSKVICFLFPEDVKVVRKKMLEEMNATEKVEFAHRQKASAVSFFGKKQYQQALNLYAGAVDAVRFVQHDASSSNEVRADLVEVMVTCSNNSATCCVQMCRWPEAAKFAQNAIVLLDALYNKRGLKIHTILRDKGICDARAFGEWRVKSLLIIARACAEKSEYQDAIDILKRARDVIGSFCSAGGDNANVGLNATDALTSASVKQLQTQNKEVRKLLTACIERKKALKKREQQRAKAMFGGGKKKTASGSNRDVSPLSTAESSKTMPMRGREIEEEKKEGILESQGIDGEFTSARNSTVEENDVISTKANAPSSSVLRPASPESKSQIRKSVSFSDVVEEREIESDEESEPWYDDHKEALLLLGVGGLAVVSFMLLRGLKRS